MTDRGPFGFCAQVTSPYTHSRGPGSSGHHSLRCVTAYDAQPHAYLTPAGAGGSRRARLFFLAMSQTRCDNRQTPKKRLQCAYRHCKRANSANTLELLIRRKQNSAHVPVGPRAVVRAAETPTWSLGPRALIDHSMRAVGSLTGRGGRSTCPRSRRWRTPAPGNPRLRAWRDGRSGAPWSA